MGVVRRNLMALFSVLIPMYVEDLWKRKRRDVDDETKEDEEQRESNSPLCSQNDSDKILYLAVVIALSSCLTWAMIIS